MSTNTWKAWYSVKDQPLGDALRAARAEAAKEHPDTPTEAMMTPAFHSASSGALIFVLVIGKPTTPIDPHFGRPYMRAQP